ncbi:glycerophosphodiester phosphodiesterase family protein [Brachybacterium nesterenkovii]|uniref:glycerophosphodiester phosphodiesterase family protein n=1 Tax=Brachybacterium nesterenkovii TaxID=47847 RepID=UPI00321A8B37
MRSSTSSEADRPRPYGPGRLPRIIAHRGLALDGAENTLRAFADALEAGADVLETDAHATADGRAVALHDGDLRRVAGDPRRIHEVPSTQLAAVRVRGSEPVPLLEDVLGAFDAPVNIDVKTPRAVDAVATAIARTASADRVCVTSFDGRAARAAVARICRLTGVRVRRSPSTGAMTAFALALAVGAPQSAVDRILRPFAALQIPPRHRGHALVTARSLAAAHAAGCEVHVWTIDDEPTMRDLLAMGADGIVTNRSDVLAGLLGRGPGAGSPV